MEEKKSRIRNALDAKTNTYTNQGALEYKYNTEKLKEENKYRVTGDAFPEKINQFNWGAFILTPIWGLFNNSPIACLVIVLGFIPFIGILLSFLFALYCGIKGNEWAWKNKNWTNIRQFHYIQKKWAQAGIIVEIIMIIAISTFATSFINKLINPLG